MVTFSLNGGVGMRLLKEADVDDLYDVINANRQLLAQWMPRAAEQTRGDTRAFVRSIHEQWATHNGF